MAATPAPVLQTVTDGRLTLKKAHLTYLGNPETVEVTYGPGRSVAIHLPQRLQQHLDDLIGDPTGRLTADQSAVHLRLGAVHEEVAVDELGRLRLPALFTRRLQLPDKGAKVVLLSGRGNGWIEVWNETDFDDMVEEGPDEWLATYHRLSAEVKGKEQG